MKKRRKRPPPKMLNPRSGENSKQLMPHKSVNLKYEKTYYAICKQLKIYG